VDLFQARVLEVDGDDDIRDCIEDVLDQVSVSGRGVEGIDPLHSLRTSVHGEELILNEGPKEFRL